MSGFLSTTNSKAFSLTATMYKGFASNGTTLVIGLYEADEMIYPTTTGDRTTIRGGMKRPRPLFAECNLGAELTRLAF